jgi:hypothetical protein
MKRVRANGGARTALQPEGIIILGQYGSHVNIAQKFGVPIPGPGDSVAVRVIPATKSGAGIVVIDGGFWKVAQPKDPIVRAPDLPGV